MWDSINNNLDESYKKISAKNNEGYPIAIENISNSIISSNSYEDEIENKFNKHCYA